MDRQTFLKATKIKLCLQAVAWLLLFLLRTNLLHAADLSNVPMDTQKGVPPNILLTLDTSISMGRFYLPDTLPRKHTSLPDWQAFNSDYNYIYYNPYITYTQGVDSNGKTLSNGPTFSSAWEDGYNHTLCSSQKSSAIDQVSLMTQFPLAWSQNDKCLVGSTSAFYYASTKLILNSSGCTYPSTNAGCYTKVDLGNPGFKGFIAPSTRTDCTGTDNSGNTICTLSNEQQNFANWFSYYRNRLLMAKTTASLSFSKLSNAVRVTHQTLTSSIPMIEPFNSTNRAAFFNWLQNETPTTYTPLRNALIRAGEYFSKPASDPDDPYLNTPGQVNTKEYACRQNFNIIITDGMWNQDLTLKPPGTYNDADSGSPLLPEKTLGITSFTSQSPYADGVTTTGYPTTLADIAFHYWVTDLRTDLKNEVPQYLPDETSDWNGDGKVDSTDWFYNPNNDPATWQHLVDFTIPLGLTGNLTFDKNYYNHPFKDPNNKNITNWPLIKTVFDASDPAKADDLWHTAINSRGGFFTADNPTDLVSSLSNVLDSISHRSAASTGAAVSQSAYLTGTYVFQPVYDSSDWHGDLLQYKIPDLSNPINYAKDVLQGQNNNGAGRVIISYNDATSSGIPFQWTSLSTNEQNLLGGSSLGSSILNYIRGDQTNEQKNSGTFRNRKYVLGDIVDSTPVYVGPPNLHYPDSIEPSSPYSQFVASKAEKNRESMVWVGANDGMLHGFDAKTLNEVIAYVPSSVYQNLPALASPSYTHKFYVDGTPTEGDVFFNNKWHSILVGGLNHGGKSIYALDVTDPNSFSSESTAASDVLWEYTPANDTNAGDLGYTYSTPQISKMNNDSWAVIFGNGYNSTNGHAILYIVNAKDGSLIRKIDVGSITDPTGQNRPNGLSTVTLADYNGDYKTDAIYAGDLFGNLWKFDVSSSNPSKWTVETVGGKATPLFSAQYKDANGATHTQAITTAPVLAYNALEPGYMILFGTGSYLGKSDLTDTTMQSFYGIWDRNNPTINGIQTIKRSDLLAQSILIDNTTQFSQYNISARATTNNPMTWYLDTGYPTNAAIQGYLGWHLDLLEPPNATQNGERVTTEPQTYGNRILFITNTPSVDPCLGGGSSWIMELNATTGQPISSSPFDYNNDGNFSSGAVGGADLIDDGSGNYLVGSGIQFTNSGKLNGAYLVSGTDGNGKLIVSNGKGAETSINTYGFGTGQRSWIELP